MNIFKKKKAVLECYTPLDYIARHFPVEQASKNKPKAFLDMPTQMAAPANYTACPYSKLINGRKMNTIRACDGILDMWSRSYILTAPFDVAINVKNNKVEYQSTNQTLHPLTQHPSAQFTPLFSGYANVKIVIPWKFISNRSFYWMFSPAIYHLDEDVRNSILIPPGVVNYKYVHSTNINLLVKLQEEQKVIHIKAGTPLVYLTPMTTEPVDIHIKTVERTYWEGLENQTIGFKSVYKFLKRRDKVQSDT